jgi:flagellar assembly protein FliH
MPVSSRFIRKEDLSAFQRWEMGGIGEQAPRLDPDVRLPTAGEVQAMQDEAILEGYNAGLAQTQAQAAQLAAVLQNIDSARQGMQERLAEEILELALDVASQIVRAALKARPELILPLVREAVQALPAVQGEPMLVLHPADADLVREQLAEELERGRWRIATDPGLPAGGCRIDSAGGDVDATLGKRWSRVMAALGKDHVWLD